jgi:hypothetical protein
VHLIFIGGRMKIISAFLLLTMMITSRQAAANNDRYLCECGLYFLTLKMDTRGMNWDADTLVSASSAEQAEIEARKKCNRREPVVLFGNIHHPRIVKNSCELLGRTSQR